MGKKYCAILFFLLSTIISHGQCSPDITPPTMTCPANITVTCPYDVPFISPNAIDNCGLVVLQTWTLSGATTGASPATGINDASLEIFKAGTTTVTYYIEDNSGNSNSCSFTVTIEDFTIPNVVTCPPNVTYPNDNGLCSAKVNNLPSNPKKLGFPTAFDNCSGLYLVASGIPPGYIFPVGDTFVTWTITDAAGNAVACSQQKVTILDVEDPIISCPGNILVNAPDGFCDAFVNIPLAITTDNCTINSITNSYNSGGNNASGTYPLGTTLVTFTATDASGRTTSCNLEVTVISSQSPVITLNGSSTISIEACNGYTELGASATDICLGDISSSIIIDASAVNTNAVGTYMVTYNVSGAIQVTRTVNVVDTTKPTLTLVGPNPLTIGDCASFTELGAIAIDPCFGNISGSISIDNSTVNPGVLGSYTVTYNVFDDSGNAATQITRTVNVIDVNVPEIELIGDNPQIIDACTSYVELGAIAIDPCFGTDISGNLIIDTSSVNLGLTGSYNVTYNVTDAFGNSAIEVVRTIDVVDATIIADAGTDFSNSTCTDTTVYLAGNAVSGSSTGLWSVTSGQSSGFSFSDASSPTATFIGDVGEIYELTWSIYNPCGISSDTVNVTFIGCNALDFDGVDDNITFNNNYNFAGDFSIELWLKSDIANGNTQTIISKRESNNQIDGYDLRIVNNIISFHWNNGQSLSSPFPITTQIWHHVAITFGGGIYKLYVDGIQVSSVSGALPISNNFDCIVGAMDQTINPPFKPLNYFDGGMDELRIWNVALSANQIHKMMNQEIENSSGSIKGSVIQQDVIGLTWNNLDGYYQMNQSTDLAGGDLVSISTSAINGKLRYMTTLQAETAPLPYVSNNNGLWADSNTWLYGNSQTIPNAMGIDGVTPINWNIVRTFHNISSGDDNKTLLGLDINSNTLFIENTNPLDGQSLRITDYLKIDGVLDLVGESQLLQDMGSIVDVTGTGSLQRDQQGTTNLYNYNYWGSPVSLNGNSYTINGVLRDGTDPDNLQSLQWTSSYNANGSTNPITLSNRWLYSFENFLQNSYADWRFLGQNGTLKIGNGFTMKGSGASSSDQNYAFTGIPNNGTYNLPINAGNEALVSNPYPSALDAHEFIFDNSSSIQGALYFWEHYISNNTHDLEDYEGGYAVYTLAGGNPATSHPEVSGQGTPLKIPERYVPVAQGFFVHANSTGGNIVFENDQRFFVKEKVTGDSNNGSVFYRKAGETHKKETQDDPIKRIRIQFKSPEGIIRPLLLSFVPNGLASDGFDYGYDAINVDYFPNDMLWMIEDKKCVIQGVGDFVETKQYPLGLFMTNSGNIEVALVALENFDTPINVFIYDALLGTYTKINDFSYQSNIVAGDYLNRFFLTFFQNNALDVADEILQQLVVKYLMKSNEIFIKIPSSVDLKQMYLYNMLGQVISSWNVAKMPSQSGELRIPVNKIAEGLYIIKVETLSGSLTKQIIVKY